MIKQHTSELYQREVEVKLVATIGKVSCLFAIMCNIIIIIHSQFFVNEQFGIWEKEMDEHATMKADAISSIVAPYILFLNRTVRMFESPLGQMDDFCANYAVCNSSDANVGCISQIYKYQSFQYNKIFKAEQKPLVFFYNIQTRNIIGLTFNDSQIANRLNSFLNPSDVLVSTMQTEIANNNKKSFAYFQYQNNLVVCEFQNTTKNSCNYTSCIVFNSSLLFATDSFDFNYTIHLNNETLRNDLPIGQQIASIKQQFHQQKLLNCEGFEVPGEFDRCFTKYMKHPVGLMKCYLTQVSIRALPVLVLRKALNLPALTQLDYAYYKTEIQTDQLLITIFPRKDIYKNISETIQQIDQHNFRLCEFTLYALILYSVLTRFNRLFIQRGLVNRIQELAEKSISEVNIETCFEEFRPLAEMNLKYQWMKRLIDCQSDKSVILEQGLGYFRHSPKDYNKTLEFIFSELIFHSSLAGFEHKTIQYYEELIKLKLSRLHGCEQIKVQMEAINQIYHLEVKKANAYYQYLLKNKQNIQQANSEIKYTDRLDQFQETFDISQDLFDLSTLVKCKIRSVLGKPVCYRRLLQLQKSENEDVRSAAFLVTAQELGKKSPQFDINLVNALCKALFECNTDSQFKRECLKQLSQALSRNELHESFISEVNSMASYYCSNRKHFYVLIESFDGLDERFVKKILLKMVSYLRKSDVIEVLSLSEDFRNNLVISLEDPAAEKLFNEHLKRISEQYQGSRRSRSSLVDKLVSNFRRMMNFETTDQSKYIVIVLSDGSYSDLRSQKDSIKKCHFQKLQLGNTYIHLVMIGNNIKSESFQKSKLMKSLKSAESFLQIDLKDCDSVSNNQEIQIFFRSSSYE